MSQFKEYMHGVKWVNICQAGRGLCSGPKMKCGHLNNCGLRSVGIAPDGVKYGMYCYSGLRIITDRLYKEIIEEGVGK